MIIFCEGEDDKEFFEKLLEHLGKQCQITPLGGKSKVLDKKSYNPYTKQINEGKITKVLFVLDSDFIDDDKKYNGLDNTANAIEKLIKNLAWGIESDYYIFDKNLDDFIIKTLDNKDTFEACEKCLGLRKINKNRKVLSTLYKKFYPKAPYDFSHSNFEALTNKLNTLLTP